MQNIVPVVRITSNGKVLLLQRKSDSKYPDLWCYPGGKIDPGETEMQAASRELFEETGIQVDPNKLIHIGHVPCLSREDLLFSVYAMDFPVKPTVSLETTFQGYGWFAHKHLDDSVIMEPAQ